jgi:hypothetical protein
MIAKSVAAEVERFGGAESGGPCKPKLQLVDAKLEVVRTGWMLRYFGIFRRVRGFDRAHRVQRDEIN